MLTGEQVMAMRQEWAFFAEHGPSVGEQLRAEKALALLDHLATVTAERDRYREALENIASSSPAAVPLYWGSRQLEDCGACEGMQSIARAALGEAGRD